MSSLFLSLFLVLVTVSSILAQCPPQPSISNTQPPIPDKATGQGQITQSMFINHTSAERPQSGLVKDAIISVVQHGVQCSDIIVIGLSATFGDGITWGTIVDFALNAPTASIEAIGEAYNASLTLPASSNGMTTAVRSKFPTGGFSVTAIPTSDLISFFINAKIEKNRRSNTGANPIIVGEGRQNTSVAYQPCVVSRWADCDGCKKEKSQIVTRQIVVPATGGGSCPATQMLVYCDKKCLTDWQIGLIALACFLFIVFICICLYCVCVRRRPTPARDRAQQKAIELATPAPTNYDNNEKIDLDVVDPVRPSTGYEEPANIHRASSETGTGPRPTATFHDDDEPAETKPTPEPEEAKTAQPEPVPVAAPPAARANVVRVHL